MRERASEMEDRSRALDKSLAAFRAQLGAVNAALEGELAALPGVDQMLAGMSRGLRIQRKRLEEVRTRHLAATGALDRARTALRALKWAISLRRSIRV